MFLASIGDFEVPSKNGGFVTSKSNFKSSFPGNTSPEMKNERMIFQKGLCINVFCMPENRHPVRFIAVTLAMGIVGLALELQFQNQYQHQVF